MKNIKVDTKKLIYIFFCIGLVMTISGGFSSFLISLREDHQQVLRRMDDVSSIFEKFNDDTTKFEETRDALYTDVLGNVYYDTLYSSDKDVKKDIKNYEDLLNDLTKDVKKMDDLCGNVYYPDKRVNNMCVNYKSIYEQAVNYFVGDIKSYNDSIKKYNEYQKSIDSDKTVKKYKTDYKYIDYNGDKAFDGKE